MERSATDPGLLRDRLHAHTESKSSSSQFFAERLRLERDTHGQFPAPPSQVEERWRWRGPLGAAFECLQGQLDPAGDPRVRFAPRSLPSADLAFVLPQPGGQFGLGEAQAAPDRPQAVWQPLARRLRIKAEELDNPAVVPRQGRGTPRLP
jgi:hypothetical protein